ncbi:MAG: reductive dehalogenase [Chloroflexota bacterium]
MRDQHTRRSTMPHSSRYTIIQMRRRSLSEWLAGVVWIIVLFILLEYIFSSFQENEVQAAALAGALFIGVLLAGIITQIVRNVEARAPKDFHQETPCVDADDDFSCEEAEQPEKSSRRDFFQAMGMAGVTLGVGGVAGLAASGTALGPAMSGGVYRRPWWVRQVDQPTLGIDWEMIHRVNAARDTLAVEGLGRFASPEENRRLQKLWSENELNRLAVNEPGYTLKDIALANAFRSARNVMDRTFLGPQRAPRPQGLGVGRWDASPEENARLIKTAMQQMGAALVGVVELNERTRKLIYSVDNDGKRLEFDDVQEPYEDQGKRVIPYGARWVIVYAVQMSDIALKRAPTKIAQMTTHEAYQRGLMIQNNLQEFLRGLGYQGLGEANLNGLGIAPALAVVAGLGELSRLNRLITPEFGPMVRIFKLITDFPLAPDKPIDAGIARFCRACKKCAEACPPSALSFETEPGWQPVGEWGNSGHQAWFEDSVRCKRYWYEELGTNCGICFSVCPFSKRNRSFMHDLIRMQVATFPQLHGLVRNMDDAFGYGIQKAPEDWWNLDLPEYGIDTHKG